MSILLLHNYLPHFVTGRLRVSSLRVGSYLGLQNGLINLYSGVLINGMLVHVHVDMLLCNNSL